MLRVFKFVFIDSLGEILPKVMSILHDLHNTAVMSKDSISIVLNLEQDVSPTSYRNVKVEVNYASRI